MKLNTFLIPLAIPLCNVFVFATLAAGVAMETDDIARMLGRRKGKNHKKNKDDKQVSSC
jgi:hypothetical protein